MPANIRSTANHIKETLMPAVNRLYPEGTSFGSVIRDFIKEYLSVWRPSHRQVARNLTLILKELGSVTDMALLSDLRSSSWASGLLIDKSVLGCEGPLKSKK